MKKEVIRLTVLQFITLCVLKQLQETGKETYELVGPDVKYRHFVNALNKLREYGLVDYEQFRTLKSVYFGGNKFYRLIFKGLKVHPFKIVEYSYTLKHGKIYVARL